MPLDRMKARCAARPHNLPQLKRARTNTCLHLRVSLHHLLSPPISYPDPSHSYSILSSLVQATKETSSSARYRPGSRRDDARIPVKPFSPHVSPDLLFTRPALSRVPCSSRGPCSSLLLEKVTVKRRSWYGKRLQLAHVTVLCMHVGAAPKLLSTHLTFDYVLLPDHIPSYK